MEKFPLVSIVTPAYNQAEYLDETIQSVLSQDYPNIEYIVIDDGSTDNTPEVLQKYTGRIYHERQPNMGQAKVLNRGWTMAKGSLIGYLSSDDRLEPFAISRLVQTLQQHADASVAYCDFTLIDDKGKKFITVHAEDYNEKRLIVDLVCQPGPGALFRKEVYERTGGWREDLKQVADFEFWLRASKFGPFVRVPQVLANYRVHEGSASFRVISYERSMEIIDVMKDYWNGRQDKKQVASMSAAYLISARSHAQSKRIKVSFKQISNAIKLKRSNLANFKLWRMLLGGIFRRYLYRIRRNSKIR